MQNDKVGPAFNGPKKENPRDNAIAFVFGIIVVIKLAFGVSWMTLFGGIAILVLCIAIPVTLTKYPNLNKNLGKNTLTILLIAVGIGGAVMYSWIGKTFAITSVQEQPQQTPATPPKPLTQAEIEANKAKEKAELAKQKAEDDAYARSPAGKLCTKHQTWSKQECADTVAGKYWIGMRVEMLVYQRGNPNHINPSNYGRGTMYQYCWSDWTPSCFYDNNEDGVMDSFN